MKICRKTFWASKNHFEKWKLFEAWEVSSFYETVEIRIICDVLFYTYFFDFNESFE